MTLLLVAAGLTVLISSVCSLFEAVLYSTRLGALEAERVEGKHSKLAERFIGMKTNITEPTSSILVVNTIANTAGATICGMYATQILGSAMVPVVSVALTLAILFVGEILPKTYGATHWPSLWHWVVLPLAALGRALSPVIKITQWFADSFSGSHAGTVITEDEIKASIRLGRKAGELSASELQLLNAAFHFEELRVRQVMVPRREIVFLDLQWPFRKCLEVATSTRHTRFPLCRGSLDEATGLVHVKDLLGATEVDGFEVTAVARPIQHVPETLHISRLLRQMQESHQHMALVDDEYGSVVGMVTLENVVEQLVGAVQDEFDHEMPDIKQEGPVTYWVKGQVPLARVNSECGLDLYSPEVDTLSGLLVSRLGRLVKAGDRVQLRGAVAVVVEEKGGRANQVRLHLAAEDEEDQADD